MKQKLLHLIFSLLFMLLLSLFVVSCTSNTTVNPESGEEPAALSFSYNTLEEAEDKLIAAYYDTADFRHLLRFEYDLYALLRTDPKVMDYPFTRLLDTINSEEGYGMCVSSTADNKIRIFSWATLTGGTMIDWYNIFQYRDGDSIYTYKRCLYDLLHPENEYVETAIDKIYTFECNNGKTVYVAVENFRGSSQYANQDITPIIIKDGEVKEVQGFFQGGKLSKDEYYLEYNISDWYFRANYGEGWDYLIRYDDKNDNLYVFLTEDDYDLNCERGFYFISPAITGQYEVYHFDGERLVYQKRDGGFWLHPSLRQFDMMLLMTQTKDYRIRIDLMSDGRFRYSSWKRPKNMIDEPDIVLFGNEYDRKSFIFQGKDGYEYEVSEESGLVVKKDGKTVLSQKALGYGEKW